MVENFSDEISFSGMIGWDFKSEKFDEVLFFDILEHFNYLLFILLIGLDKVCFEQLSVKLADHFINYRRCLLVLNDSEHESPQNHIFEEYVKHHGAFSQKKSEKIFHGEEDFVIF